MQCNGKSVDAIMEEAYLETTMSWQWATAASTKSAASSWKPVVRKAISELRIMFIHVARITIINQYRVTISSQGQLHIAWWWNHLPSSGLENLLRFWAQATDILAALASNASNTTLGFNQSAAAGNKNKYNITTHI